MSTLECWQRPFMDVPPHAEWIAVDAAGEARWSVEKLRMINTVWSNVWSLGQFGHLAWVPPPIDSTKAIRRVLPEERVCHLDWVKP